MEEIESAMIKGCLIKAYWSTKAASLIGISERMLRYKMKKVQYSARRP
jgi:transcriptional regulator with PAS, ATPase and Fis domain